MNIINRICPKCNKPNYVVSLGNFSSAFQYKCMNCNSYLLEEDLLPAQKGDNSGWISVKDRLPEQTPSLFSIFKDTDKWSKAMWAMDSETVLVTVAAKGESIVTTGKLQDGKWCTRISPVIEYKVTHWMPLPEPPKEESE